MSADVDPNVDTDGEKRVARLTGWFRKRPTSLEFWEVVVTDRRAVLCFVGESFSSLLLRADVGERGRRAVADARPDELPTLDEHNFAVPLENLRTLRLWEGSCLRRPRLSFAWTADGGDVSWTLYGTNGGDPRVDAVRALADDDRLAHADVSVEDAGLLG